MVEKEDLVCYFVTANIIPSFDVTTPLQYDFLPINSRTSRTFSSVSLRPSLSAPLGLVCVTM